jgi:hypothetical protein
MRHLPTAATGQPVFKALSASASGYKKGPERAALMLCFGWSQSFNGEALELKPVGV